MPQTRLPFVNFEDERLAGMNGDQLGLLLDRYGRAQPEAMASGGILWSFDEIQNVPGWERFVRRLLDRGDGEIIITGSSAALLSREIATALRDRGWEVPLYPFSFGAALAHAGIEAPATPGALTAKARARVEHAFLRWLEIGGFPEVQDMDTAERRQTLLDYVDVAMLRDVVERHEVTNVQALRWLVRHLLGNVGSPFSIEKFHGVPGSQGTAVGRDTLHRLLAHPEDCFLARTVWMDTTSERQRMVNPRKAYPVDAGFTPLHGRTGRSNIGHALETAVLIELQRRRCEVRYVRSPSGYEADFLARYPDGSETLIQVCADASAVETARREIRALVDAGDPYPLRSACSWLPPVTRCPRKCPQKSPLSRLTSGCSATLRRSRLLANRGNCRASRAGPAFGTSNLARLAASVSRRMRAICSSLNRLFPIYLCSVCRGHLLEFQTGRESEGRSSCAHMRPSSQHEGCSSQLAAQEATRSRDLNLARALPPGRWCGRAAPLLRGRRVPGRRLQPPGSVAGPA